MNRSKKIRSTALSRCLSSGSVLPLVALLVSGTVIQPTSVHGQEAAASSQSSPRATGSVHGRVFNTETGRYLSKASVTVKDSNITTLTDDFGDYTLNNIPAGKVTIAVSFSGLPEIAGETDISGGETVTLNFNFNQKKDDDGAVVLESYVVRADRFKNAQQTATAQERYSTTIKNVVAADAFGDIPSGNIGEMVKFIPGIQIEYGNYNSGQFGNAQRDASQVSVRGFDANDTAILIDGLPVASAAPGNLSRVVGLDMLSVNNASRVEVIKVATPDMPNNSIGGQVNLISKSAFEYAKISTTARVFTQLSSKDPITLRRTASPLGGKSYKTQPSFDVSTVVPLNPSFGFTVTASRIFEFDTQTRLQPFWWLTGRRNGTGAFGTPSTNQPGLITNSAGVPLSFANPYYSGLQLSDIPQETERYSGNIKLDWKPNQYNTLSLNLQYSRFTGSEYQRRLTYKIGAGTNNGLSAGRINNANEAGGGVVNNSNGTVNFNNTPLDWGPTFTISRLSSGSITSGNRAELEVLNGFDKEGDTQTASLIYRFARRGWRAEATASRSVADSSFESTKNGHYTGALAVLDGINQIKFLDISQGLPGRIEITNAAGALMDLTQLGAWRPDSFTANFGDSHVRNTKSVYKVDLSRELDFIPLPILRSTSIKIGARRDEEKVEKSGLGTNLKADFDPASGFTTAEIFAQIADQRGSTSPGYHYPAQQWIDPYKLYELDQKNHFFKPTAAQEKANWDAYAQQQKDLTETKDAWYAQLEGRYLDGRLSVVGGLRQESTSRKGRSVKQFSNAALAMYADGRRYTEPGAPVGGYSVTNATSLIFQQTAAGAALRARLDAAGVFYKKDATGVAVPFDTNSIEFAMRQRQILAPVNAKVSGDPSMTVAASYEITKKLVFKPSWSRSFGQPELETSDNGGLLSASGGYMVTNYTSDVVGPGKDGVLDPVTGEYTLYGYYGTVRIANPALEMEVSDNIDLQLAYYTDNGGKYAVTYWTKSVDNQTYSFTIDRSSPAYAQFGEFIGIDLEKTPYHLSTSVNLPGTQKTHGYEFEVRQNLEPLNLWGWGKAFTVFGTWSIQSVGKPATLPSFNLPANNGVSIATTPTTQLVSQKSDHFGSAGIFFQKGKVSASARAVYRNRNEKSFVRMTTVDQGNVLRFFDPEEMRVDLSLNVLLTKRFSIFGSARDVFYHRKESEVFDDFGTLASYTSLADRRSYGAVISVGIRGEF